MAYRCDLGTPAPSERRIGRDTAATRGQWAACAIVVPCAAPQLSGLTLPLPNARVRLFPTGRIRRLMHFSLGSLGLDPAMHVWAPLDRPSIRRSSPSCRPPLGWRLALF